MPFKAVGEGDSEKEKGTWTYWKKDPDSGKPVRFRLRTIPPSFNGVLRARYNRGIKSDQIGKRPAVEVMERQIEATRDRALYSIMDSENFVILIGGASTAEALTGLLGKPVEAGQELIVDGNWPALGKFLLDLFPPLAAWISEKADELAGLEADEEEELGKT
jgi:hypothetical protein